MLSNDLLFDPQLSFQDLAGLDDFLRELKPSTSLEVGCWKGLSTSVIAKWSKLLFCVDTWQGAENVPNMTKEAKERDVLDIFINNMRLFNIMHKILIYQMPSEAALKKITGGLDFIFIDAGHGYRDVRFDIEQWREKLTPGGIIAGHDCEVLMKDLPRNLQDLVNAKCEEDCFSHEGLPRGVHPGVTKAIHDIFQDDVNIIPKTTIWWKKI